MSQLECPNTRPSRAVSQACVALADGAAAVYAATRGGGPRLPLRATARLVCGEVLLLALKSFGGLLLIIYTFIGQTEAWLFRDGLLTVGDVFRVMPNCLLPLLFDMTGVFFSGASEVSAIAEALGPLALSIEPECFVNVPF